MIIWGVFEPQREPFFAIDLQIAKFLICCMQTGIPPGTPAGTSAAYRLRTGGHFGPQSDVVSSCALIRFIDLIIICMFHIDSLREIVQFVYVRVNGKMHEICQTGPFVLTGTPAGTPAGTPEPYRLHTG